MISDAAPPAAEPRPKHRDAWLPRGLAAVTRHEMRMLAHAPMTPIFLGGFLLTLAALVFVAGDFYASDHASAGLLWTFLPWAAVVFVPALAMRAFAEEQGDRSTELMLTMPVDPVAIAGGKWLAGSGILLVALAGTLPFVATLAHLGAPDWGALAGGYLGAAMMLSVFLAIALFAAALTRDAAGGYVLGLLSLFAILVSGWDTALRAVQGTPLQTAAGALAAISPKTWLDAFASGRIEAGAIAAYVVLTALALGGTVWALEARRRGSRRQRLDRRGLSIAALVLVGVVLVPMLAGRLPLLADLSEGRAYSLHSETIGAARSVKPGTTVDFYWSADEARVPAAIKAHAARTRAMLRTLAARSGGRLALTEHNAVPDSDAEANGLTAGLRRVPMSSGDSFMLGVVFRQGDRYGTIPYLDIRRDQQLEYDVALALTSLGRHKTPRVGLLSPLLMPRNVTEPREGLAVLEEVKRSYDVAIVPHFADALPEGLDAVVVIGATILKREMLYALDQHVMRGKGLIVLVDPFARFNSASDTVVPQPSEEINDISDLLLRYGVRFEPDSVVGDAKLASPVTGADARQISYPFWIRIGRDQLSSAHSVSANLNELLFAEPGALTITPAAQRARNVTALVTTSEGSGALARASASGKSAEEIAALFVADGKPRTLAAAIDGPFESAFAAPPGNIAAAHAARSTGPAGVFAVADMDFIFDPMAFQEVVTGDRRHARPLNDNIAFLLNMIEYATGDPRLLAIRSRGTLQRPFTRVAQLLAASQSRYRDQESRLLAAISKVEGDIRKVVEVAGVKEVSELPPAIREKITALLSALQPHRRELRQIRLGMREDVDRLGVRLTLINLAAALVFALLFALAARFARVRRLRSIRTE